MNKAIVIVLVVLALGLAGCTCVVGYQNADGGSTCTINVSPNQPLDLGVQINPTTQPARE